MGVREFVAKNRAQIDEHINKECRRHDPPGFKRDPVQLNDDYRRQWVLSDYTLYVWALSEGVKE